jgi:hypothetical protein
VPSCPRKAVAVCPVRDLQAAEAMYWVVCSCLRRQYSVVVQFEFLTDCGLDGNCLVR